VTIEEARARAPTVLGLLAQGVPREEILSRHPGLSHQGDEAQVADPLDQCAL